ncbi:MAG: hypothetical protein HQK89_12260 [Nitrospirae bacterium]|nr:hypothetical protein [Nitrospirota bacterium]
MGISTPQLMELTNWSGPTNVAGIHLIFSVAYGGNTFVVGDDNGNIYTSTTNGASWSAANNIAGPGKFIHALAYGGNTFVAGENSGNVYTSANGVSWSAANNIAINGYIFTIAYSGTTFVAGDGNSGTVYYAAVIFVPTVTTTAISGINSTAAGSGGTVTSNGGGAVTAEGVCWSTSANPTVANSCTNDGTSTPFTSSITGLTVETTYHVRAYATNSAGTGYGSDVQFTTVSYSVTYRFPYFHTAAANVIYCVASNVTSQDATVSFQPKAGGVYISSWFTSINLGTLKANAIDMFTFNGNTATSFAGGVQKTISGPDTSTKGVFYGAYLSFTATTATSPLNCNNITVTCFQGTTTPKRNLVGYLCIDTSGGFFPY